jgi:ubiquinone biosynthesis accessory factor UbiJ
VTHFNHASAALIEQLGNRLLALDAEANHRLNQFAGKVIHIHITDLSLDYYLLFPGGSLVVQPTSERQASASISGKLSAFIAAATSAESGDAIFSGDLHFSGEVNTARQFQTFAQALQIDWREPFSRYFGDVLGHSISGGLLKLHELGKGLLNNLKQDIPEYLQEEIRVTPTAFEISHFCDQVDLLRSQADRLQARIERLTHHD